MFRDRLHDAVFCQQGTPRGAALIHGILPVGLVKQQCASCEREKHSTAPVTSPEDPWRKGTRRRQIRKHGHTSLQWNPAPHRNQEKKKVHDPSSAPRNGIPEAWYSLISERSTEQSLLPQSTCVQMQRLWEPPRTRGWGLWPELLRQVWASLLFQPLMYLEITLQSFHPEKSDWCYHCTYNIPWPGDLRTRVEAPAPRQSKCLPMVPLTLSSHWPGLESFYRKEVRVISGRYQDAASPSTHLLCVLRDSLSPLPTFCLGSPLWTTCKSTHWKRLLGSRITLVKILLHPSNPKNMCALSIPIHSM